MRFNILAILGLIAVEAFSANKLRQFPSVQGGFPSMRRPSSNQAVVMNNKATANGSSFAVNAGFCGDANALTSANAGNYNMISQNSGPNGAY
jgi:hypothetical protein